MEHALGLSPQPGFEANGSPAAGNSNGFDMQDFDLSSLQAADFAWPAASTSLQPFGQAQSSKPSGSVQSPHTGDFAADHFAGLLDNNYQSPPQQPTEVNSPFPAASSMDAAAQQRLFELLLSYQQEQRANSNGFAIPTANQPTVPIGTSSWPAPAYSSANFAPATSAPAGQMAFSAFSHKPESMAPPFHNSASNGFSMAPPTSSVHSSPFIQPQATQMSYQQYRQQNPVGASTGGSSFATTENNWDDSDVCSSVAQFGSRN